MTQPQETTPALPPSLVGLAAAWVIAFLVLFFQQTLPNNAPASRPDVWQAIFLDADKLLNPLDYSSIGPEDAGWSHLSQRLPFAGVALLMLAVSWTMGRSVTRCLPGLAGLLRSERLVLDLGGGLALFSLWVLACGLAGLLNPAAITAPVVLLLSFLLPMTQSDTPTASLPPAKPSARLSRWWYVAFAPFALHIFLGGFTPPFDFDVREYHLQGPREWFEAGRIFNLDHNVYTTFPFLSEMLSLAAMVIHGDKWEGAISGKVSLTVFQFRSTTAAWAIARRWCGATAAAVAALIVLSTPWTTRISIIAYAEGAISFYIIASAMAALLAAAAQGAATRKSLCILSGFLAGSAMASKYPGVISAVIPIGIFLLAAMLRNSELSEHRLQKVTKLACVYLIAVLAAVGPWLLKNAIVNHNPVYPLAYGVLGGRDWDSEMNTKWVRAHSSTEHEVSRIPIHLWDAAVRNDWQNGLLFAFSIPALMLTGRIRQLRWIWLHAAWILVTWWALTHRIDRFWVPVIPLLAVAAGASWDLSKTRFWRSIFVTAVIICSVYNYGFSRLSVVGFHAGLADLNALKSVPVRADIALLNSTLPDSSRVLMVGEAEVFDADFNLVYNTVFDDNIFETWTAETGQTGVPRSDKRMKSASKIRRLLGDHGITHVYVNWSEVLRYRMTYGFTKYVSPSRFLTLQQSGVLSEPQILSQGSWDKLSEQQQREINSWPAGDSLRSRDGRWNMTLLYQVRHN